MTDLSRLNSATKYPSIETYHQLDPKNGALLEQPPMHFDDDQVIATEKIDGANARIIVMPDGDYFIGSREELFHARGDRVWNNQLSIVNTLKYLADAGLYPAGSGVIKTFYFEVFGGGIGQGYKNYTTSKTHTDYRLFDLSFVPMTVLDWSRDRIAAWRDRGGQEWAVEEMLQLTSGVEGVELTPRLGAVDRYDLPLTIEGTYEWLQKTLPATEAALDPTGRGKPEGIVLRSPNRAAIAKVKFADYERTIRRRATTPQEEGGSGMTAGR